MTETQNAAAAIKPQASFEFPDTPAASLLKASVDSRHIMAMRRPRNDDAAAQKILEHCKRARFAADRRTWYCHPLHGEGLGIGFVETAFRLLKNIYVETGLVSETDTREVNLVRVTDLEVNVSYPLELPISKTVERYNPALDGSCVAVRLNATGRPVYSLPATDDDVMNRKAVLTSKAIRVLGLRLIPSELQAEARETIRATREAEASRDIDASRMQVIKLLDGMGVNLESLELYLKHPALEMTAGEIVDLRCAADFMRDGEISWTQIMEKREPNWLGAADSTPEKATKKTATARIVAAVGGPTIESHAHVTAEPAEKPTAPDIDAVNAMAAEAAAQDQQLQTSTEPPPATPTPEATPMPAAQPATDEQKASPLAGFTARTSRVRPTRQTTDSLNLA
jgi:hypothetical protein